MMISIIVPVYNSEKYIDKCLDSILNQTYKDLEIVLVNDGSNDQSLKILEKYALRDRVLLWHEWTGTDQYCWCER